MAPKTTALRDLIEALPPERRRWVERRTQELIAEERARRAAAGLGDDYSTAEQPEPVRRLREDPPAQGEAASS